MWPKLNWEVQQKLKRNQYIVHESHFDSCHAFCSRYYCADTIKCKEDGAGMKFEPPNVTWIGDHPCSRGSNIRRLKLKECCISSNWFTACLSSKMGRLNPPWVIEGITVLRRNRLLIDRFLVPSSVMSLRFPLLLMTSKLSSTFWLSRKLWQGKCQIMGSLLHFLTPSICFPAWVWQRSCVGLIGCLFSPGSG